MKTFLDSISDNESMCQEIGELIEDLLNLKKSQGKINTTYGTKTPIGLTRTIIRIIKESNDKRTNTLNLLESNEEV